MEDETDHLSILKKLVELNVHKDRDASLHALDTLAPYYEDEDPEVRKALIVFLEHAAKAQWHTCVAKACAGLQVLLTDGDDSVLRRSIIAINNVYKATFQHFVSCTDPTAPMQWARLVSAKAEVLRLQTDATVQLTPPTRASTIKFSETVITSIEGTWLDPNHPYINMAALKDEGGVLFDRLIKAARSGGPDEALPYRAAEFVTTLNTLKVCGTATEKYFLAACTTFTHLLLHTPEESDSLSSAQAGMIRHTLKTQSLLLLKHGVVSPSPKGEDALKRRQQAMIDLAEQLSSNGLADQVRRVVPRSLLPPSLRETTPGGGSMPAHKRARRDDPRKAVAKPRAAPPPVNFVTGDTLTEDECTKIAKESRTRIMRAWKDVGIELGPRSVFRELTLSRLSTLSDQALSAKSADDTPASNKQPIPATLHDTIRQCLDDLPRRHKLILTLLNDLFHAERSNSASTPHTPVSPIATGDLWTDSAAGSVYYQALSYIISRLQLTVSRSHFKYLISILLDAPWLPYGILQQVCDGVESGEAVEHGLNILKTVCLYRHGPSNVRLKALELILSLSTHSEPSVRDKVTKLVVMGLWPTQELSGPIEKKASDLIDDLILGFQVEELELLHRKAQLASQSTAPAADADTGSKSETQTPKQEPDPSAVKSEAGDTSAMKSETGATMDVDAAGGEDVEYTIPEDDEYNPDADEYDPDADEYDPDADEYDPDADPDAPGVKAEGGFRADATTVQWYLDLPAALSCRVPTLFTRIFELYGTVAAAHMEATEASRLARDARDQATNALKHAQVALSKVQQGTEEVSEDEKKTLESESARLVEAAEKLKLAAEQRERDAETLSCPSAVAIASSLEKTLNKFVNFAGKQFGKPMLLQLVERVSEGATPLIVRMCEILAASEIISIANPQAVQLYEAATALRATRLKNIRYIVPFLGVLPADSLRPVLIQLLPWSKIDFRDPAKQDALKAQMGLSGKPLTPAEFEKALRYLVNSVGKQGTEPAVARAAELVEMVVTLVDSSIVDTMLRCMFTAFKVLAASEVIGTAALERAMLRMADSRTTPFLYMRFVHEAVSHNPNLGQFVCTQIMPALVRNSIWSEKERWQGFILLAKKFANPQPPTCLGSLVGLPPSRLRDLLAVIPEIKPPLEEFVKAQSRVPAEIREVLGL